MARDALRPFARIAEAQANGNSEAGITIKPEEIEAARLAFDAVEKALSQK